MAVDPGSVIAAIQILGSALQSVASIFASFKNAPAKIRDLERDCNFTYGLLAAIRCNVDANHDVDPTREDSSPVNLSRLLRDTICQLQFEVDELRRELKKLPNSESKIGRWVSSGVVVWKRPYLDGMQQKIRTKQEHLQIVLQCRRTHQDIAVLLGSIAFGLFHGIERHVSDTPGYLLPTDPQMRERLTKAVANKDGRAVRELLRRRLDPNFQSNDEEQVYPLHIAARNGDLAVIELLISQGARLGCTSHYNATPLMVALDHGQFNAALFLIQCGPRTVPMMDNDRRSAIHIAARKNSYAVIKVLLANGADPNAPSSSGYTPLMEAVLREDRELVDHDISVLGVLLDPERHGVADATPASLAPATFQDRHNALHLAAAGDYVEDVQLLLRSLQSRNHAQECSAGDALGHTPLWLAARNGHLDVVKLLIDFDPSSPSQISQDPEAPSPLWALTVSELDPTAIKTGLSLLATPADLNARNTKGSTLLHRAAFTGDIDLTAFLLNAGADPQIQDNIGRQPLHYAALRGHEYVLTLLLAHRNVTPDCVDNGGMTPLMLAAGSGHDFIIRIRTNYGADILSQSNMGYSALYIACAQGHVLVAAYLLGRGADIDGLDRKENTPLHVAARNGQVEMVRWLLRMGADKAKRSVEAFEGLRVAGTVEEVVKAVEFKEEGLSERILGLLEGWKMEE